MAKWYEVPSTNKLRGSLWSMGFVSFCRKCAVSTIPVLSFQSNHNFRIPESAITCQLFYKWGGNGEGSGSEGARGVMGMAMGLAYCSSHSVQFPDG